MSAWLTAIAFFPSEETLLRFFVSVVLLIGLLRLVWPEVARLVRLIWRDLMMAADAIRSRRS